MENQNKVANSLSLGSKFTDGDGIERHYLERNFFDWIELHELKDVGLIENSIDQFLPHLDNTGYYQVSRNSTKNLTKEPHQYGELIILGFRCYQISSSQELIPVGTSNDRFQLRSKHFQTEKSNHSSIIFQPNMILANKNYYPMIGNEVTNRLILITISDGNCSLCHSLQYFISRYFPDR